MKLDRIPGWAGPIIGPIAGLGIAYQGFARRGLKDLDTCRRYDAWFALAGFVGGLLVWSLDWHSHGHWRGADQLMSRLPPESREGVDREAR